MMNLQLIRVAAFAVITAMGSSGCSNLSAGENAAFFGGLTAVAVGVPLALAGVDPAITIPVTAGAAVLAAGAAYVIAKHQATQQQRRIAEERAKLYLARMEQEQKEQAAAAARKTASSSTSSSGSSTSSSSKPKPQPEKAPIEVPKYIAVETEQEEGYKGKSAVMVYDTQKKALVGNDVYDLKSAPKTGSVSKFDTVQAEYVGTGA